MLDPSTYSCGVSLSWLEPFMLKLQPLSGLQMPPRSWFTH